MKKDVRIVSCLIILLLIGACQKQEDQSEFIVAEEIRPKVLASKADFSEIPDFSEELAKSEIGASKEERGQKRFWLDRESIYRAVDSVGNKTYSIRIRTKKTQPKVFYNLIVTNRVSGNRMKPFILEFVLKNQTVGEYFITVDKNFEGQINRYSLREFAQTYGLTQSGAGDPCYNDVGPNNTTVVNNNSGSTGGGGGGSGNGSYSGGNSGPGSYGGSSGSVVYANTGGGATGTVEVGEGCFCVASEKPEGQDQQKSYTRNSKNDPCAQDDNEEIVIIFNPEEDFVEAPDQAILDMLDYLRCLKGSKGGKVTVYVDEPDAGSGDAFDVSWSGSVNVGHTFVTLQQGNEIMTFGFYPGQGVNPITGNTTAPGVMNNDQGHAYSASISVNASAAEMSSILNYAINYQSTYNLNTYNCTDFAIAIGNIAGMNLPPSNGTWPNGAGSNPGTLGAHIRGLSSNSSQTIVTSGSSNKKAPRNKKGC